MLFGLYDVTARADASYTIDDMQPFSVLAGLYQDETETPVKYATLEEDFTWGDGTFEEFPDSPAGFEIWSRSMSDSDGKFQTPPVIEIRFNENHTSAGLTFHFYGPTNDYPSEIFIEWFGSNGNLLSSDIFRPSSYEYYAENTVVDYRSIRVTILSMSKPYRYFKLTNIDYGLERVFGKESIKTASLKETVDPIAATLPVNEFKFSVISEDDDFSPLNPVGTFALLQQNQKCDVFEMIGEGKVPLGSFYLDKWTDAKENSISFSTVDAIGYLDGSEFEGGMYENYPVRQLLDSILSSTEIEYELDSSFEDAAISNHLPICTRREAIQQIAIAIGAVVSTSRTNVISILPPTSRSSSYIDYGRKYFGEKLQYRDIVTGVDVTSHSYQPDIETKDIFNDELAAGTYNIRFDLPMYSIDAEGAEIIFQSVNRVEISVESDSEVAIYGVPYVDNPRVFRKRLANLPAATKQNVLSVESAMLVNDANVKSVAERIFDYYQYRYEYDLPIVTENEIPGNTVLISSIRNEKMRGVVETMSFPSLNSTFKSTIRVVGQRVNTGVYDYAGELYAGDEIGVI